MKKRFVNRSSYSYLGFILFFLSVGLLFFALPNVNHSGLQNFLTGAATSETTTLSITVNSAPVIFQVRQVHSQSITEGSNIIITNITFNVTDADGFGDINNNSAQIRINLTGEQDRFNSSCKVASQFSSTGVSFNCTVDIWYFDSAGNWTINVSINDSAGVYAENNSNSVEIFSTTGMVMSPNALTWATLELGDTNKTSNNDPVLINNTGNKNINVGGVTVTGYNLQGQTLATDFINAANFSIFPTNGTLGCTGVGCLECNGTMLLNATSRVVAYANITRGNNTIGSENGTSGQENLYFCLRLVPTTISRQVYSTTGAFTSAWTVAVS
ncbi:MAG TPA: hypothetical protein VJC39_01800 [Candidatus Nanoarchaeia archaeon]|nr:hypothetical protein [Candidatus Nanoarchaeia archaeon]